MIHFLRCSRNKSIIYFFSCFLFLTLLQMSSFPTPTSLPATHPLAASPLALTTLCPWVRHTCSLANPFTFFYPVAPSSPLQLSGSYASHFPLVPENPICSGPERHPLGDFSSSTNRRPKLQSGEGPEGAALADQDRSLCEVTLTRNIEKHGSMSNFLNKFLKRFYLFILQRGKGKKRGRETSVCGCLSHAP